MKCRERDYVHQGNRSVFRYTNNEKTLLDGYKYSELKSLSALYANIVSRIIDQYYYDFLIVPVPTSPLTISSRGWGHIEEICKILAKSGYAVIFNAIEKRKGSSQKHLNREQRIKNSYSLFSHEQNSILYKRSVLLFDDVYTTGSTLDACAKLLKKSRPLIIKCLTLYRD